MLMRLNSTLHSCRGTRDFSISMSDDNVNYEEVVSGTLTDARNLDCEDIHLETFELTAPRTEKFIKFTAVNFYGAGSALQYMSWE